MGKSLQSFRLDGSLRILAAAVTPEHEYLEEIGRDVGIPSALVRDPQGELLHVTTFCLPDLERLSIVGAGVEALAFSPNGRLLASGGDNIIIHLWDHKSGDIKRQLTREGPGTHALAFSPDGKVLAVGGRDNVIHLWDPVKGEERGQFGRHPMNGVHNLAYSPDGKLLVSRGIDNKVYVWDVAADKLCNQLGGRTTYAPSLALAASGRMIAIGDTENVRVYELDTGRKIHRFRADRHHVLALAFTADGRLLATGGSEHVIRLWDMNSGEEVQEMDGHEGDIVHLVFFADGKQLVSASKDGTALIWDVSRLAGNTAPRP